MVADSDSRTSTYIASAFRRRVSLRCFISGLLIESIDVFHAAKYCSAEELSVEPLFSRELARLCAAVTLLVNCLNWSVRFA